MPIPMRGKLRGRQLPAILSIICQLNTVETSEQLDEMLEDLVIYRPVAGAGHGESWNAAPADYEQAFSEFLRFATQEAESSSG